MTIFNFFTIYMNIYVIYDFEMKLCISRNGKFMNDCWFIVYKKCFNYWIDIIWCMEVEVWNYWENFDLRWGALFVVCDSASATLLCCIIKMEVNSGKKKTHTHTHTHTKDGLFLYNNDRPYGLKIKEGPNVAFKAKLGLYGH